MLIYFLILLVPLLVGLLRKPDAPLNREAFLLYFMGLLLFCGFRLNIGPDWSGYQNIYHTYLDQEWSYLFYNREPAFFLLNKIIHYMGLDFQGVVFLSSAIFLVGLFTYARTCINPWLALAVVMPYFVFVVAMSGMRQSCAIGVGFYMIAHWRRLHVIKMVLLVALAASFHNSAIVLLIFVVVSLQANLLIKFALGLMTVALIIPTMDESVTLMRYKNVYIDNNLVSSGAFFHVALTSFPAALFLLFRKRIEQVTSYEPNVLYASIGALLALPLLKFSSTGIDRLALYLSFVQMWVYPALLRAQIVRPKYATLPLLYIVLSIFFVYFYFGSHASSYVPYNNIWF